MKISVAIHHDWPTGCYHGQQSDDETHVAYERTGQPDNIKSKTDNPHQTHHGTVLGGKSTELLVAYCIHYDIYYILACKNTKN